MSYIFIMLICIGIILLDNLLHYLLFIDMIDLSRIYGSTASLIYKSLVVFMIYSWIKIKIKALIFPTAATSNRKKFTADYSQFAILRSPYGLLPCGPLENVL
jgi:hypothetical protein